MHAEGYVGITASRDFIWSKDCACKCVAALHESLGKLYNWTHMLDSCNIQTSRLAKLIAWLTRLLELLIICTGS